MLPSQHYLSVKQYSYSMFTVLRCTVQKKSPTIYCTGLPFTFLFTANDLVPLGLSIYLIKVTAIYTTHQSLQVHLASKNQIMVVSMPFLTRKVNMGTIFPQTHCKRDSNFGYSFVFCVFFVILFFLTKKKKSKGQRTLAGKDLDRHILVSLILIHVKSIGT